MFIHKNFNIFSHDKNVMCKPTVYTVKILCLAHILLYILEKKIKVRLQCFSTDKLNEEVRFKGLKHIQNNSNVVRRL